MVVIQSVGQLADLDRGFLTSGIRTGVRLYDTYFYDYATLYRTQPNVRTCVDFLSRNIAQLGLHVFRRVSDTDRVRLIDHPLATLLGRPMPKQFKVTTYRLIESLMGDLGVYFNAYWVKFYDDDRQPTALLRIPPPLVEVKGGLSITGYVVNVGGKKFNCPPEEIVHFRGYNTDSATVGLSPMETLRRILAEEQATGAYRENFWQNAARQAGIILRPAETHVEEWSDVARARFKAEWEAMYSGEVNSGKTAILEEGMTWEAGTFSPQESEYLGGKKLTREECARSYHIPLPMVGILDHATFSNITEQHKNLYQDSLGPWLEMIQQDIELQLLTDYDDSQGVYVEFNIAAKLAGSFEEQVKAMQSAVGRPWMTANEARARQNLPRMDGDADLLVTPLNVIVGGMASPRDADPAKGLGEVFLDAEARLKGARFMREVLAEALAVSAAAAGDPLPGPPPGGEGGGGTKADDVVVDATRPRLRARYQEQWRRLMKRIFDRQQASVVAKMGGAAIPDMAVLWDAERWDREVADDFLKLGSMTASAWSQLVAEQMNFTFDDGRMLPWLQENARVGAEYVNATTQRQVAAAVMEEEPKSAVARVFELAVGVRAVEFAISRVTTLANFGTQDAAQASGLRTKTWQVNSGNPRPSHAALNGVSVGIRETFPNGLRWPGDPRGTADDNAGCECSVVFGQ